MPLEPIPIANLQESGIDRMAGASPVAMNVVVNGKGVVTKRPCITTYSGATTDAIDSSGLDAIHVVDDGTMYVLGSYATGHRKIYKVTAGGALCISNAAAEQVLGSSRPVLCETGALLVIAAGNVMQKVLLSTQVSSRLGGTPPEASHVIGNNTRLLANDVTVDKTSIRFSDPAIGAAYAGHETWSYGGFGTSGYFTAEARPDPVVALSENSSEIYVFGRTTVQSYVGDVITTSTNDTVVHYAPAGILEYGCIGPYSVIKMDDGAAWLDHKKRFIVSAGEISPISDAIQADLDAMDTITDGFGYQVKLGNVDCLAWTFPTDERTFVFQKGIGWGQWAGWDSDNANWKRFPVNCVFRNPLDGAILVGTTDGKVGQLSMSAYSDLGDEVPAYVETGYIDHGTGKRKWCKNVIAHIRRGDTSSTTAPVAYLSFSDRMGQWSGRVPISLGVGGDTVTPIPLGPMGTYETRAWRFEFSPTERLSLVGLEEEFEILEV